MVKKPNRLRPPHTQKIAQKPEQDANRKVIEWAGQTYTKKKTTKKK